MKSVEEIIATKSVKKVKKNQTSKEENACFVAVVVVCVCVILLNVSAVLFLQSYL